MKFLNINGEEKLVTAGNHWIMNLTDFNKEKNLRLFMDVNVNDFDYSNKFQCFITANDSRKIIKIDLRGKTQIY